MSRLHRLVAAFVSVGPSGFCAGRLSSGSMQAVTRVQMSIDQTKVAAFAGPKDYRDPAAIAALVRETLATLNLTPDFIQPGEKIVLKPNWVKEHDERHPGPNQWEHVVT